MEFLKKSYDMFAWSQGDVLRIDPQVAIHKLFTNPDHSLIHQRRRKFTPEHLEVIEEEVAKLIKANIIKKSHYLDCSPTLSSPQKKGEVESMC